MGGGAAANVVAVKSKNFALRVIKLHHYLRTERSEEVMAKQLLRCGTSVGANVREALQGQSKSDFIAKMGIALKEIAEAQYWLELLHESSYIEGHAFLSIYEDCTEVAKILTSIIKTAKSNP